MAAPPTIPFVTVAEYLNSSYEPECEYIEGVLEPKTLPTAPHSILHFLLFKLLCSLGESSNFMPLSELRIRLAGRRFRVPDLVLMPNEWVNNRELLPLAVIEIVSPDDTFGALLDKTRDYHAAGIQNIVVVDPHKRALFVADERGVLQGKEPAVVTLTLPDRPDLTIDFDAFFAQVPQE